VTTKPTTKRSWAPYTRESIFSFDVRPHEWEQYLAEQRELAKGKADASSRPEPHDPEKVSTNAQGKAK
jgi:hypothetical protein